MVLWQGAQVSLGIIGGAGLLCHAPHEICQTEQGQSRYAQACPARDPSCLLESPPPAHPS